MAVFTFLYKIIQTVPNRINIAYENPTLTKESGTEIQQYLTNFMSLVSFYTPFKNQ